MSAIKGLKHVTDRAGSKPSAAKQFIKNKAEFVEIYMGRCLPLRDINPEM